MDKYSLEKSALQYLYPAIEPYDRWFLDTDGVHRIYVEEVGNPDGIPVVVFHGGPGGGCSPAMRRFFDPSVFRIVLFDQRGCGRSRPTASVTDNTTWHLIQDTEAIRSRLGIESWIVFGGSWGATLGLLYAQTHPDRVRHLVLRGVFAMTRAELDWFYGGQAGKFFPEAWQIFIDPIPEDERADLITAYHKRLFCGHRSEEIRYAQIWAGWENMLATLKPMAHSVRGPDDAAHAFARLENHYFFNRGFLETDRQIFKNMDRIAQIPGTIVQGRYDMICPPVTAYEIAQRWPAAELRMLATAGHALSEPSISAELIRTMDRLAVEMDR